MSEEANCFIYLRFDVFKFAFFKSPKEILGFVAFDAEVQQMHFFKAPVHFSERQSFQNIVANKQNCQIEIKLTTRKVSAIMFSHFLDPSRGTPGEIFCESTAIDCHRHSLLAELVSRMGSSSYFKNLIFRHFLGND